MDLSSHSVLVRIIPKEEMSDYSPQNIVDHAVWDGFDIEIIDSESIRREVIEECLFIVDGHVSLHRDNVSEATAFSLECVAKRIRALSDPRPDAKERNSRGIESNREEL